MPEGVTHIVSRYDHLECDHTAKMGKFSGENKSVCVCEGTVLPVQLIFFCDGKEKAVVVIYLNFSKRCVSHGIILNRNWLHIAWTDVQFSGRRGV